MTQIEMFAEPKAQAPVRVPDITVVSREFADMIYDDYGQISRDALQFRIELYTRAALAQFSVQ
jgi:hypothetical protein